jgi:hypothetical protein
MKSRIPSTARGVLVDADRDVDLYPGGLRNRFKTVIEKRTPFNYCSDFHEMKFFCSVDVSRFSNPACFSCGAANFYIIKRRARISRRAGHGRQAYRGTGDGTPSANAQLSVQPAADRYVFCGWSRATENSFYFLPGLSPRAVPPLI